MHGGFEPKQLRPPESLGAYRSHLIFSLVGGVVIKNRKTFVSIEHHYHHADRWLSRLIGIGFDNHRQESGENAIARGGGKRERCPFLIIKST